MILGPFGDSSCLFKLKHARNQRHLGVDLKSGLNLAAIIKLKFNILKFWLNLGATTKFELNTQI